MVRKILEPPNDVYLLHDMSSCCKRFWTELNLALGIFGGLSICGLPLLLRCSPTGIAAKNVGHLIGPFLVNAEFNFLASQGLLYSWNLRCSELGINKCLWGETLLENLGLTYFHFPSLLILTSQLLSAIFASVALKLPAFYNCFQWDVWSNKSYSIVGRRNSPFVFSLDLVRTVFGYFDAIFLL